MQNNMQILIRKTTDKQRKISSIRKTSEQKEQDNKQTKRKGVPRPSVHAFVLNYEGSRSIGTYEGRSSAVRTSEHLMRQQIAIAGSNG